MKISALIPNLATNCIVRGWPILKVLERQHQVEVIGSLAEGEELFPPYAKEFDYKIVRRPGRGGVWSTLRRLEAQITGDVIYAFKPLTLSYGAALLARWHHRRPVILDIEDWETWSEHKARGLRQALRVAKYLAGPGWSVPHSSKYRYAMEQLTSLASARTVVSSFLQRRYGGTILRHGADTTVFNPARYDGRALREKWGIAKDLRLVLWSGSPSAYKGLDDILAALDLIGRRDVMLLMAGKGGAPVGHEGKVLHLGFLPHTAMPELLAMADLVVLPQRRHPVAEAQIPAKVFEAMAMAKPVVATAISDLPELLAGSGLIVEPENVPRLAEAIQTVLEDGQRAEEIGERGRQRHEKEYSWDAMERVLAPLVKSVA